MCPSDLAGAHRRLQRKTKSLNMPFAILILCEPSQPPQAEPQIFLLAPVALCTRLHHTHHHTEFRVNGPSSMCHVFLHQCWEIFHGFLLSPRHGLSLKVNPGDHLTKLTRPFVLTSRYLLLQSHVSPLGFSLTPAFHTHSTQEAAPLSS